MFRVSSTQNYHMHILYLSYILKNPLPILAYNNNEACQINFTLHFSEPVSLQCLDHVRSLFYSLTTGTELPDCMNGRKRRNNRRDLVFISIFFYDFDEMKRNATEEEI